jgi:REP-associated tyrosine transposase
MSHYRRSKADGGFYFFTVTLADRSSDLLVRQIDRLRRIYASVQSRYPFETVAICILPDHLHAIWSLPSGDRNYPLRWSVIKAGFFARARATISSLEEQDCQTRKRAVATSLLGARYTG